MSTREQEPLDRRDQECISGTWPLPSIRLPLFPLLLVIYLLPATLPTPALAAPHIPPIWEDKVVEFPLPGISARPGGVARGGWLFVDTTASGQPDGGYITSIARVNYRGQITEFPLPPPPLELGASVDVAEEDGWFTRPGRIGQFESNDQITEFPLPRAGAIPNAITQGQPGRWFTEEIGSSGEDAIGFISVTGKVIHEYALPSGVGPKAITLGPELNLWFTEYLANAIGRITPEGQIKQFPLPIAAARPSGITEGPDGNLWFTDEQGVGRITAEGEVTEFRTHKPVDSGAAFGTSPPGQIAEGSDGGLWFSDGPGTLGRIAPDGQIKQVKLHDQQLVPVGIASGPNRSITFTAVPSSCAASDGPCGSAGTQDRSVIGRVTPGLLSVEVLGSKVRVHNGKAEVRLACGGLSINSICHGVLKLRPIDGGRSFGAQPYWIRSETERRLEVHLRLAALAPWSRRSELPATATATVDHQFSTKHFSHHVILVLR